MRVGPPVRLTNSDSADPLSWVARIVSDENEEIGALWDGRESRFAIVSLGTLLRIATETDHNHDRDGARNTACGPCVAQAELGLLDGSLLRGRKVGRSPSPR